MPLVLRKKELGALWWAALCLSLGAAATVDPCRGADGCAECIRAHPSCAWCISTKEKEPAERCRPRKEAEDLCPDYEFPDNQLLDSKEEEEPDRRARPAERVVQIRPREIGVRLRPEMVYRLKIEYKQAENYPVDLYYLMDLSNSMRDDKKRLEELGDVLAKEMKNITKKFQLGFGSFVEKVALPYVNTHLDKIKEYETPYSFRNYMPLDTDTGRFRKEVNAARISGNYDPPEGGLDALVQAVVCQGQINWRNKSRKLLVFSTDAGYHMAGDGKLAGIVLPNDGRCHLDGEGQYTESLNRDYPSVGQVRSLISKHKVNVIFAVTRDQVPIYRNLADRLDGATVGTLDSDSSNVVRLIREQYDKIKSTIKLTDTASAPIKVTYFSSCLGKPFGQTDTCENIPVGGNVTFVAELVAGSCPSDPSRWKQTFHIQPTDLNEAVTVRVEILCQCHCQTSDSRKDSSNCSDSGTFRCGVCSCHPDRYGKKCECDAKDNATRYDDQACFRENQAVACSGRGKCFCGQCQCYPRQDPREEVSGSHCQCDNFSCDRLNNLPCGGPERGRCQCGVCQCLPGWKGRVCDCRTSNVTCIDPHTQKTCNDRGECRCGECLCQQTKEERYDGDYCQECLICPGSCGAYRECAHCKMWGSDPDCGNCTGLYREYRQTDDVSDSKECAFDDDQGCRFFFFYRLSEEGVPLVLVKKRKECPRPVNALTVGLGVTGGIVALGLLALLIWKLVTTVHDSREYAKFLKEAERRKWNQGSNPLYKEATSTFQNPAFGS